MHLSSLILGGALLKASEAAPVASQDKVVPVAEITAATYHTWAHKHWVWLHHGQSNQQNATDIVDGYLSRGIPVGGYNIDSEWATEFNNFIVDTNKFPDFNSLVSSMHDLNVMVTMWVTSMVNVENPDYQYCLDNNFFVRNGNGEVRPIHWWKGDGALIDYTNPAAVEWWHGNMDKVLDAGVDGFKCDETDMYISEYIALSGAALGYNNASITYRDYANAYYRDFLFYPREKRGDDSTLIMSRPIDCGLDSFTKVCAPSSPYDVMYSGWMGDDDHSFNGLTGCARKVIYSAWDNYTNFGCDIGGYRDTGDDDRAVFIRWAQFGAFLPFMENGGGGEHRPLMYDEEVTGIYKTYVREHYRLIPYLMAAGVQSMASQGTQSVILPMAQKGGEADTPDYENPQPSTYSYLLGADILVHPVLNDKSAVHMTFPAGCPHTVWLDWFHPLDLSSAVQGQETAFSRWAHPDMASYPVYVRKAALLPLQTSPDEDDEAVFTWFAPDPSSSSSPPSPLSRTASVPQPASQGPGLVGTVTLSEEGVFVGTLSAHTRMKSGWKLLGVTRPEGTETTPAAAPCSSEYDEESATLTILCADLSQGVIFSASGVFPKLL
jgi:alpha-glucosidase (family GH31 glycosyl hydrolase)